MAAGELPLPGSKYGPCKDPTCGHIDCASTRLMAASTCRFCSQPIGYETRFYDDRTKEQRDEQITNAGFVHADCLEKDVEERR